MKKERNRGMIIANYQGLIKNYSIIKLAIIVMDTLKKLKGKKIGKFLYSFFYKIKELLT